MHIFDRPASVGAMALCGALVPYMDTVNLDRGSLAFFGVVTCERCREAAERCGRPRLRLRQRARDSRALRGEV